MTLQSDMQAASEEYARRLDQQAEADRLAALRLEARKHTNSAAFGAALQDAFDQLDTNTDDQEN